MTDIPRYAIIATRNRSQVALECLATVTPQADATLVIDNGDDDPIPEAPLARTLTQYYVVRYEMQPVNLSHLWNAGLDWAEADAKRMGVDAWDVAVINDDVLLEEGWFSTVSFAMRSTGSSAGCTGPANVTHREAKPVPLHTRMQGWAFMLRGERGLRLDESMAWWYADDDLGWRAAADGGMAMVRGPQAHNRFPNGQMTPERQTQAQVDGLTFVAKWGTRPW